MQESDIARAERLDHIRAALAPVLGLLVLFANQWLFFGRAWDKVAPLQLGLWLGLMLFVLSLVLTGGTWLMPRALRELLDDEATRVSRMFAIATGFVAAMLVTLLVFVAAPFAPISAQRAAHIILTAALGMALVMFGLVELRHRA